LLAIPRLHQSEYDHALLLTNGTVVLTLSYRCVPGPGGDTAGMLSTGVIQSPNFTSPLTVAPATCHDRVHPASTDNAECIETSRANPTRRASMVVSILTL
jgi:hypothetical protein